MVELRVRADKASLLFREHQGTPVGDQVLKVVLAGDDPRLAEVGRLQQELRARGESFFWHWHLYREYSESELASARLLRLLIPTVFEPAGEECGTAYNEAVACPVCGAGRVLASMLRLNVRRIPKKVDFARTVVRDEWVVSRRVADVLVKAGVTGLDFRPIEHSTARKPVGLDMHRVPAGQELVRRGAAAGLRPGTAEFALWTRAPEQAELFEQVVREVVARDEAKRSKRKAVMSPDWCQLAITSSPVVVAAKTQVGVNPFEQRADSAACPRGDTLGSNLLSEVHVRGETWTGSDFSRTAQYFGTRFGVLVPAPVLLISPRVYRLLKETAARGWDVEVARCE